MKIVEAGLLAVIQGVTEFFPVSSSGHLAIAQWWMGFEVAPIWFDVSVHLGTLIAVLVFFKKNYSVWLKIGSY